MPVGFSDTSTRQYTMASTTPTSTNVSTGDSETPLKKARWVYSPSTLDSRSFVDQERADIERRKMQRAASAASPTRQTDPLSYRSGRSSRWSSPPPSSSDDFTQSSDADDESGLQSLDGTRGGTEGQTTQGASVELPLRARIKRRGRSSGRPKKTKTSCTHGTSNIRPSSRPQTSQSSKTARTTAATDTATDTETIGTGRWLLDGLVSTVRGATEATAEAVAAMGRSLAESAFSGIGNDTERATRTETDRVIRIGAFPSDGSATTGNTAPTGTIGTITTGLHLSRRGELWRGRSTRQTNGTVTTRRRPKGFKRAAAMAMIGRTSELRSIMTDLSSGSRLMGRLNAGSSAYTGGGPRRNGALFDADTLAKLEGLTDGTTATAASIPRKRWYSRKTQVTTGAIGPLSVAPIASSIAHTGTTFTCKHTTAESRSFFGRRRQNPPIIETQSEHSQTVNTAGTGQSWYSYWTGQPSVAPITRTDSAISALPRKSLLSRLRGQSASPTATATMTEVSVAPSAATDTAASQSYAYTAASTAGTALSTALSVGWNVTCATSKALGAGGRTIYNRYIAEKHAGFETDGTGGNGVKVDPGTEPGTRTPPDTRKAFPTGRGGLKK